jgi:hypothetical protein
MIKLLIAKLLTEGKSESPYWHFEDPSGYNLGSLGWWVKLGSPSGVLYTKLRDAAIDAGPCRTDPKESLKSIKRPEIDVWAVKIQLSIVGRAKL